MAVMSHVEIGVSDLTRAAEFYGGLLGFAEDGARSGGDTLVMAAGAATVRLVEVGHDATPSGWSPDDLQRGFRHFGMKVDAVDARLAVLEDAGVPVRLRPLDAAGGVRIAFFADPDGTHLEFVAGQLRYDPVWSPALVAEEEAGLHNGWDGTPRFDHVAVTVDDLDRALGYYRDTLGIPVLGQLDHRATDERGFVITYLRAGETVIEVFSFRADTAPGPWRPAPDLLGIRSVGLTVPDPAAARAALTAAGGTALTRPGARPVELVADGDQLVAELVRA
ncbi:VOC family protein [Streptomyces sp. NPDC050560]|uniref:VOC family protein n=1 Tax=Streptomyces sp. NPDC050560 TaxID=3365630 RepID=UPI00378EB3A8